ncbi:PP2C family protein-serine/threonine phosphatase [Micromonospora sp. NPDC050417]|uniref:PP2C family protein-serine/threonine phosphatase n=1 Tax=Micromonospora sp. NPDC050417 TaxID=3364280 RepID=UPI0037A4A1BF
MPVLAGIATHQGGRSANADAAVVHRYGSGDVTTAVVVDGIGSDQEVVDMVLVAAEVIARTAARTSPVAGIMAAAAMTADTAYLDPGPDAVAVCAMVAPERGTLKIGWIGDCRAYAWTGEELVQVTEDHTMGRRMRVAGWPEDVARKVDNWVRATVSMATISTVMEARIEDEDLPILVLLTSDGVHDALTHDQLVKLVRQPASPQSLADALVAEAVAQPGDEPADNATAVVLLLS